MLGEIPFAVRAPWSKQKKTSEHCTPHPVRKFSASDSFTIQRTKGVYEKVFIRYACIRNKPELRIASSTVVNSVTNLPWTRILIGRNLLRSVRKNPFRWRWCACHAWSLCDAVITRATCTRVDVYGHVDADVGDAGSGRRRSKRDWNYKPYK